MNKKRYEEKLETIKKALSDFSIHKDTDSENYLEWDTVDIPIFSFQIPVQNCHDTLVKIQKALDRALRPLEEDARVEATISPRSFICRATIYERDTFGL